MEASRKIFALHIQLYVKFEIPRLAGAWGSANDCEIWLSTEEFAVRCYKSMKDPD